MNGRYKDYALLTDMFEMLAGWLKFCFASLLQSVAFAMTVLSIMSRCQCLERGCIQVVLHLLAIWNTVLVMVSWW